MESPNIMRLPTPLYFISIFVISYRFLPAKTSIVCVLSSFQLLFLPQTNARTLSHSQQVMAHSHTPILHIYSVKYIYVLYNFNSLFLYSVTCLPVYHNLSLCVFYLCLPSKTSTVCILSSVQLLSPPQSNTLNSQQVLAYSHTPQHSIYAL